MRSTVIGTFAALGVLVAAWGACAEPPRGLLRAAADERVASPPRIRDVLNGWGPFKFGMSMAEALKAIAPDGNISKDGVLVYDTFVGDRHYRVFVEFSPLKNSIRRIHLQDDAVFASEMTKNDCDQISGAVVQQLELTYGVATEVAENGRLTYTNFVFYDGASIVHAGGRDYYNACISSITYEPSHRLRARHGY